VLSSPVSTRKRKVCGFSFELLAIDAAPHGPCFLPIAVGAAHMHLPAKAPRHA